MEKSMEKDIVVQCLEMFMKGNLLAILNKEMVRLFMLMGAFT